MTKTRYGASPWIHTFPESRRPNHPPVRGEQTTDVIIIGGGLTGCAAAYACATAGLNVVVIEANRLAQGSAGRSAGLLLPEPGPAFRDLAAAHGLRATRVMFESWRRAALEAAALLKRLNVKCGLHPLELLIAAGPDAEKGMRREYDARHEAGLPVTWMKPAQVQTLTQLDASGAIRMRDGFGLDPYRASLGLAAGARARGALFLERSRATKIRASRASVEVTTERGVVRGATVVVTTGSASPEFKPLRRHFKRREAYLVLTEPMPAAMRKAVGRRDLTVRDTHVPRHRLRWTTDDRILVMGGDQDEVPARTRDAVLLQRTGQLMYELLTMYPVISGLRPEYGWEMTYGETADGVMYVGPHRNYPRHLFALGGAPDSITGAFLAARILVRAIRGTSEKADAVFGFTR